MKVLYSKLKKINVTIQILYFSLKRWATDDRFGKTKHKEH